MSKEHIPWKVIDKSIGFYGDSFAEVWSQGRKFNTWPRQLSSKYKTKIIHKGRPGTSIWDVVLHQFIKHIPTIAIFCWTTPYRMYHDSRLQLKIETKPKNYEHKLYLRAYKEYVKYLESDKKLQAEFVACLSWFDNEVLSKIIDKTKIIHCWSLGNDIQNSSYNQYHPNQYNYVYHFKHGCEIHPPHESISMINCKNIEETANCENHMNTQDKHDIIFSYIDEAINNYEHGKIFDNTNKIAKMYKNDK